MALWSIIKWFFRDRRHLDKRIAAALGEIENISLGKSEFEIQLIRSGLNIRVTLIPHQGSHQFPESFKVMKKLTQETWGAKGNDPEIGDEEFDREIFLAAKDFPLYIPLLTSEIRKTLCQIIPHFYRLEIDKTRIEGLLKAETPDLTTILKQLILVYQSLSDPSPQEEKLWKMITEDPIPTVRHNALKHFPKEFKDPKSIADFLHKTLELEDPILQVLGALHLREKGIDHLVRILNSRDVIVGMSEDLINRVLTLYRSSQNPKVIPSLMLIFVNYYGIQIRAEILSTLKDLKFRTPELSFFLLDQYQALTHQFFKDQGYESNPLPHLALEALGECGTVEVIEKLHDLSSGVFTGYPRSDLKKVISQIQSRIKTGDQGWLSIKKPSSSEGNLSIPENEPEKGSVSIRDNKSSKKSESD